MLVSFPPPNIPPPRWVHKAGAHHHPLGWVHLALWAWALGTWHSRGAELRAGIVLGAHSAAQHLSALPVSLGAIGVTWDNPWASLPEVLEGALCPQTRGPQTPAWAEAPHYRTRSWCWIHQGPSSLGSPCSLWGPLWAVLPSPAVTGTGGRPGMNPSPLGIVPVPRSSAAGDMLTKTSGTGGTHLPHSGTL